LRLRALKESPLAAALRFLSVIPIPGEAGTSARSLEEAVPYFPVVGAILGGVAYLLALPITRLFPPYLAAVLMTTTLVVLSGGLHLDGLADSADGLFSSRPRERALEIMRDSHIGVMGVIWLLLIFLLKVTALGAMPASRAAKSIFLMPVAGRVMMLFMMAALPYVRGKDGLATIFYRRARGWGLLWGLILLLVCALTVGGPSGIAAVGASGVIALCFGLYCRQRLGGTTGDTLGAVSELAETAVAVMMALPF